MTTAPPPGNDPPPDGAGAFDGAGRSAPPGRAEEELAARLHASRRLEDAPEAVIQRALGLWHSRAAPASSAVAPESAVAAGLRRLVAVLKFDSAAASPAALGLRSGSESTRQLLYFSEGRDIDLRIAPVATPHGRQWRVSGQVFGPDVVGVAELRCGEQTRVLSWSDLAEFSFPNVGAGRCVLVLRSHDWQLELPAFDVPG